MKHPSRSRCFLWRCSSSAKSFPNRSGLLLHIKQERAGGGRGEGGGWRGKGLVVDDWEGAKGPATSSRSQRAIERINSSFNRITDGCASSYSSTSSRVRALASVADPAAASINHTCSES